VSRPYIESESNHGKMISFVWLQAVAQYWQNEIDDSQVGSNFKQALHFADNSDYDGVLRALSSMCAPCTNKIRNT